MIVSQTVVPCSFYSSADHVGLNHCSLNYSGSVSEVYSRKHAKKVGAWFQNLIYICTYVALNLILSIMDGLFTIFGVLCQL